MPTKLLLTITKPNMNSILYWLFYFQSIWCMDSLLYWLDWERLFHGGFFQQTAKVLPDWSFRLHILILSPLHYFQPWEWNSRRWYKLWFLTVGSLLSMKVMVMKCARWLLSTVLTINTFYFQNNLEWGSKYLAWLMIVHVKKYELLVMRAEQNPGS